MEMHFSNNSSRMETECAHQCFLQHDEPELSPSKKQAIEETPINEPESRINISDTHLCENPSDVRAEVTNEPIDIVSSVDSSIAVDTKDQEVRLSYGSSEDLEVNRVKNPINGRRKSVAHNLREPKDYSYRGDYKSFSLDDYQKSIIACLESPFSGYSLLYEQSTILTWEMASEEEVDGPNASTSARNPQARKFVVHPASESMKETKAVREEAPNGFFTDVKSLTGTGALDGATVRYITSSGKELLRGIIKGTGYLCGCSSCEYKMSFSASAFERHANQKTNHPNNHIYLDNGQSIYQRVQELKNTPSSMLSEVDLLNGITFVNKHEEPKVKLEATSINKPKARAARKEAKNSFPSNVKTLTMTGMFDGTPVKYRKSSGVELLSGIIQGGGYFCGCIKCKYSKVVTASEFELHAGQDTSHPNNHIFLPNGKSMHQTVQELKTTPSSMLFDVIQTVTGFPINQKAFCVWKESFLAENPDLQLIDGE